MNQVRLPLTALLSYAMPSTLFVMVRAAAYGIIPALYAERFKLSPRRRDPSQGLLLAR